jgi:SAM-dependent methyltransferase
MTKGSEMPRTQDIPYVGGEARAPLTRRLTNARTRRILPFLRGDVLELGCGASVVLDSDSARRAMTSYTGVEALPENVEALRKKHPQATFLAFDLDAGPWPLEGRFDCVLALAVIEHLWNLKTLFDQVHRHLREDGLFLLTTPTPWGNHVVLRTLSRIGLVRRNVIDDHVTIFDRQLFRHACGEFGFELAHYGKFQFGGNQLAVLRKRAAGHRASWDAQGAARVRHQAEGEQAHQEQQEAGPVHHARCEHDGGGHAMQAFGK